MAIQTPPYVLQAGSHSAELFRRALGSLITGTGVVGTSDFKVSQNTGSDLKSQVAAGQSWIPGSLGSATGFGLNINAQTSYSGIANYLTSQGPYYAYNDGAITGITHATASATNPRIDLLTVTVNDSQYSGASNNVIVQVITGTAASSPVAPTVAANSLVLGQVAIAANQTTITNANITDKRPLMCGGLIGANTLSTSVGTAQTTTSTSYTDLATVGPTVTIVVPSSGIVDVNIYANITVLTSGINAGMSFAVSGANTIAASSNQLISVGNSGTPSDTLSMTQTLTGLTPGSTTFTAKYGTLGTSGTVQFASRVITVQPRP